MGNQHSSGSFPSNSTLPPAPVPPRDPSSNPDEQKPPPAEGNPLGQRPPQWMHFKIWTQTGKCFVPISIFVEHTQLRLLPAFADLPPTKTVQFWAQQDGTWLDSSPDKLPFHIDQTARTVLVRYPGVVDCVGFPRALRLLDEERGVDLGPDEWNYVDLRSQYPRHDYGEQLTVVAYGEDDKPPTFFYVTLTKDGRLRWDLHPQLLAHVMGTSRRDYPAVFYSWNALSHSWDIIVPHEAFIPCDRYDFAVVRHKANSSTMGLSHFLAQLDDQNHRPVLRLQVAPLLTDRRPAASEPLVMEGRTKSVWPTLTSTHTRIPPRITSLSATISSVLTTPHMPRASSPSLRTSASTSSLQPSASTTLLATRRRNTKPIANVPSTPPAQPSTSTTLVSSPPKRKEIANAPEPPTPVLRRSTRVRQPRSDPANASASISPRRKKTKTKGDE